jgi:hypothetical protein
MLFLNSTAKAVHPLTTRKEPTMDLTPIDQAILSSLQKDGGWIIRDIAGGIPQPAGMSNRQHSALINQRLHIMETNGLVRRLDDEKPIAWVKA